MEQTVRAFGDAVDGYDFAAIGAALTPELDVLKSGRRDARADFSTPIRQGARDSGGPVWGCTGPGHPP